MMYFIETMIMGHDNTHYIWVSGKCAETCLECEFMDGTIKPMSLWLAEGLPNSHRIMFHECGGNCSCTLKEI